jgi:hypothetical protein
MPMAIEPIADICPRCALRDVADQRTGWCLQCAEAAALERYRDRNDQETRQRSPNEAILHPSEHSAPADGAHIAR